MLIGEYKHTLDDKNRLSIPSKFRSQLKPGAVITKGLDECLFIYTKQAWDAWAIKLSALPISQSTSRAFSRMMLGGAMEVELDKQGRVILPDYLKEYARLAKYVVIAGLYDRLEVWDADSWLQYKMRTEKDSNHIAETMAELGV